MTQLFLAAQAAPESNALGMIFGNPLVMILLMFVILYPLYFTVIALNAPNIFAARSRS